MTGKITENFTWEEFERSETASLKGIDNSIPESESVRTSIRSLVADLLQPLRNSMGVPLHINSGYRCPELNALVGGAGNSQHRLGEAADIRAADPLLLAQHVERARLPFDQMILYSNFVHLSHKASGPQRGEVVFDKSYKSAYPDSKTT